MTHVVESSVVLAYTMNEPGGQELLVPQRCLHLSIVNLAEVYTKVAERGGDITDARRVIETLGLRIRAFREAHAEGVARLRPLTSHRGLSLGDRACLALAEIVGLPVLTADHKWIDLGLEIDIRMIR